MPEVTVQMFGLKKSAATRAAERFFKERRVKVHFVDLASKPISKGELARFQQKFGPDGVLDKAGKAYEESGLPYLRLSEEGFLSKLAEFPAALKLPLVRGGKVLAVGEDPESWRKMLESEPD
ncbi:arsenate reductase [Deinococcus irradiatisoli]|uniref:Arsenate reductase n=1 Tax=Deinococcus irradiatisoli TaxID=2202254 RepID=A0A2Z3JG08_9DEIO|nr:ArsC/Spx/MgsR family protein [Deinococcus irradiatisoli]AWN22411.1 arsenate reductase [Deinococcus irradiatisoli]